MDHCSEPADDAGRYAWETRLVRGTLLLLFLVGEAPAQRPISPGEPETVRIGVMSLFHPRTLVVSSAHPITIEIDGEPHILPATEHARLRGEGNFIAVDFGVTGAVSFRGKVAKSEFAAVALTVPGRLTRKYVGVLSVTARAGTLEPVVALETEAAVASIVAAESPPDAPAEALKAQAIASRSFLLSNVAAHRNFDACDTTHCQFLRSPPPAGTAAALATKATRGMVLSWRADPSIPATIVRAMYSRSCGGQTRVPATGDGTGYPYYAVRCDYCRRHPEVWSREIADLDSRTERGRIVYNRRHGWSALPSNEFTREGSILRGRGTGHGVGLCQLGSIDMAAHGANYSEILGHFFPNTSLIALR